MCFDWYALSNCSQGQRPYKCEECNETFERGLELRRHRRSQHRMHECTICNMTPPRVFATADEACYVQLWLMSMLAAFNAADRSY